MRDSCGDAKGPCQTNKSHLGNTPSEHNSPPILSQPPFLGLSVGGRKGGRPTNPFRPSGPGAVRRLPSLGGGSTAFGCSSCLAHPDPPARGTSCTRSSGPSEAALHLPGTMPDERHFLERAHPVAEAKTPSCKAPDCFETGIRAVRAPLPGGDGTALEGQPRRNPDRMVTSRSAYKGLPGLLRDLFSFFRLHMACWSGVSIADSISCAPFISFQYLIGR
jgi:hypothetical protein